MLAHFRSPRYQPPLLPVIAVELMALSQQADTSAAEIAAVLQRDPLLAAKVLKTAQSGAYVRLNPPRSLNDAVTRLGARALRDIVFEVSLNTRIFQAPGYTEAMERLRVHSVTTAHICRELSRAVGVDGEMAFLVGLLHDVGIAGAFVALSEMPSRPSVEVAWSAVLRVHAEASGALARLWRLPPKLQVLLANHHSVMIEGKPNTLAALLCVSERFAFELAPLVGSDPSTPQRPRIMPGKDISSPDVIKQACKILRIDGTAWKRLRERAVAAVEKI